MRLLLAIALIFLCLPAPSRGADHRHFEDAPLHAVQFVGDKEGWAVGDDGVILHSIDGGETWERQPTGLRASLRSVYFLNPFTGWVIGREELPFRKGSSGVILLTRDGGVTWERRSQNTLPGLEKIQFLDARIGFIVGDGSDEYPTGIFRTNDGGASWNPIGGPRRPLWLSADFTSAGSGALVGAWGRLEVMRQDRLTPSEIDALGGRMVRSVKVTGDRAVAVGDGGLVLLSKDSAGARYGFADLKLPHDVRASLDFRSVCCLNDDIWIVGRPGTVVVHSPDRGATWEILQTGEPLPLNHVFFVNKQKGWAVGELGSILGTNDGGKTWKVHQRGGQRAALLTISGRQEKLPFETIAAMGADEGYLINAFQLVSSTPDTSDARRAADPQRLAAATRHAGGAAAETTWQFPLPQHLALARPEEILRHWNELHADRATDELLRAMVLAVRVWRPNVIVLDSPLDLSNEKTLDDLVADLVTQAVTRSGDERAYPEQLKVLGLLPWKVGKVYGRWNGAKGANVSIDLTRISQRLETTIRDFASESATYISATQPSLPLIQKYRLLASGIEGAAAHVNLLQGFDLAPGGTARRRQTLLPLTSPELDRIVRARRNMELMAEAPASPLNDPNRMLGQIGPMLEKMPESQAAPAAFTIGKQLAKNGQWSMAREVFLALVKRYPSHPLSAEACRWLIRHDGSSEARRRYELGQFWVLTESTLVDGAGLSVPDIQLTGLMHDKEKPAASETRLEKIKTEIKKLPAGQIKSQVGNFATPHSTRQWYQGSVDTATKLAAFGPVYENEAEAQFCLQSAKRQLGNFDAPLKWYQKYLNTHVDGAYREAALMELWLANRRGDAPKALTYCRQTDSRPYLDGDLQDPCWQGGRRLVLKNAQGNTTDDYPTEVALAYDMEFIYFAIQCKHPSTGYVPVVKTRTPDADVKQHDRISLMFDLDRDYSTYYHLQVDQRGCLADECVVNGPDKTWNPRWFVSCKSDKSGYQIEGAIPIPELTGEAISINRSWAFNVSRIVPGHGVQAWSIPADVEPRPEGMGILVFTQDGNKSTKPNRQESTMGKVQ
jgi:photosystem II stability/assembly factor-like uncharacterized protein